MIYESLNSWYLLHSQALRQNPVGLVVHTSWINFSKDDLTRLQTLPFQWILPENVLYELRLLLESQIRIFRDTAELILEYAGSQKPSPALTRKKWDLEQLYEKNCNPIAPDTLYSGTLIFVFGDLNKQDEFLRHVADSARHEVLLCREWSCIRGIPSVYPLSRVRGYSVRTVRALEPGAPIPAVPNIPSIREQENGEVLFSGKSLEATKMHGSYARIFRSTRYPEKYLKMYTRRALTGNQKHKLKNLQAIAKGTAHANLPLAMPEQLFFDDDGNVIGFSMKQCGGRAMRDYISSGWEVLGSDVIRVLKNLILHLLELHSMHLLVNDLSANNVLVEGDRVAFVDCDSFQVFHYPGGGITTIYQHPEISAEHYHDVLREPRYEYFAFAVLAYQCIFYTSPLLQFREADDERDPDWTNTAFPMDTNDTVNDRANPDVFEIWRAQPESLRRLWADEFHFRSDNSLGAWIRELELLD